MAKNLQLYRNSILFNSKEDAVNSLIEELGKSSDGEMVLTRYESENGDVETIFGIAYVGEEKTSYTIFEKTPEVGISENYETVAVPELSDSTYSYEQVVSGDSIDIAVHKIESGLMNLIYETLKNEYVISQALTKLNDSAGFDSKGNYAPTNIDFLLGIDTISDAINAVAKQVVLNNEKQENTEEWLTQVSEIIDNGINCGSFE